MNMYQDSGYRFWSKVNFKNGFFFMLKTLIFLYLALIEFVLASQFNWTVITILAFNIIGFLAVGLILNILGNIGKIYKQGGLIGLSYATLCAVLWIVIIPSIIFFILLIISYTVVPFDVFSIDSIRDQLF